jgi:hypothetical protein
MLVSKSPRHRLQRQKQGSFLEGKKKPRRSNEARAGCDPSVWLLNIIVYLKNFDIEFALQFEEGSSVHGLSRHQNLGP